MELSANVWKIQCAVLQLCELHAPISLYYCTMTVKTIKHLKHTYTLHIKYISEQGEILLKDLPVHDIITGQI